MKTMHLFNSEEMEMKYLSSNQIKETYASIKLLVEKFEKLGLSVEVSDDFEAYREVAESVPEPLGLSGTFDPRISNITREPSFWMCFKDDRDRVVGTRAARVFDTHDFYSEIHSMRFFSKLPPIDYRAPGIVDENLPELSGRIGYGGSIWLHPDWRGEGISGNIAKIGRLAMLAHDGIDYFVGFLETAVKARKVGVKTWGVAHRTKLFDGYYPARDKEMEVSMIWMSADEMLGEVKELLGPAKDAGLRKTAA